jgi:hypothetical protein
VMDGPDLELHGLQRAKRPLAFDQPREVAPGASFVRRCISSRRIVS